ncbi:MAG: nitrogenase component 1 [Raoultibacter sp.]
MQETHEPPRSTRRLLPIPGVFYGGGCSYMACRGLMMSGIEDVLLITHGPVGCAYYAGINGYRGSAGKDRPSFTARTFSTHMDETDVIFGGEEKLMRAIDEAVERYAPEAIALCSTCPVGLIGDDIGHVARDAAQRHGIDILPLSCEGFKSEPGWLHGGKQILDNWVGQESRETGEFPVHFMSEACGDDRAHEMKNLLDHIGYDVVCSLMGITTYREIVRSQDAKLVVLDSGKAIDDVPLLYQERYGAGFMRVYLTGIGNIAASLRSMASFFGDDRLIERTEEVIREERKRIEPIRKKYRDEYEGMRVAVFEDIFRSNDFAVLSSEMGMHVVMVAQNYDTESYTEEGFTVHVPQTLVVDLSEDERRLYGFDCASAVHRLPGCPEIDCPDREFVWLRVRLNRTRVSELLDRLAPDLCFSGIEERFGYASATMRSEKFLSDERGTDYMGFDGFERYARDIAMARDLSHWVLDRPSWMGVVTRAVR